MKIILYFVLLLTIILPAGLFSQSDNPLANPSSIVISDNARFTILTPELIRLEWSEDGIFEDRPSLVFINRNLSPVDYSVDSSNGWQTIKTDKLKLRYKKNTGKFNTDNLSIELKLNGNMVLWQPGAEDSLNLKGTTRTLDGTNGEKDVKLENGIISRCGWALVDDSKSLLFDNSDWKWVVERQKGDRIDWYFFGYGHDYKKALHDYTQVAGKIPLPPKFAFGYWWSRYWTYSDNELRDLIKEMRTYDVPIDVLIIDMDWHETYGLSSWNTRRDPFGQAVGWTGYTWNRTLFPDPKRFLKWTESENLKTALNLHPASGIAPMEEKYYEFAKVYGFDTTGKKYIPFMIEDKKWAETYFNVLLRPFEEDGVDFWWLDWQAWLENKKIKGLSNTWWLNYTFFSNMERQGKKRPLLFHRWGGLGNHRYQIGFSGDTYITWESLSFLPYFTATASNVGYGYWSHDIGGHMGGEPTSELYLRWLQFGIFSPVLRTHATKSAEIERRIWKHNDYFEMMRDAIHLRYALVPYIYSAARKTYDTGLSICRPMYYDYPDVENAYLFKSQYMFGDDMLIAPITEKANVKNELATKKIWLPEGSWYEYFTGSILKGDQVIERTFALHEIPLYIKSGSIIPMYPKRSNLQGNMDTLILTVIPGGNGSTDLYDDDGFSSNYKNGEYSFTRISKIVDKNGSVTLNVFPVKGKYSNMPVTRAYEIRLPSSFPPKLVRVNNKEYNFSSEPVYGQWWYEGKLLTTHILVPAHPCNKPLELYVEWSDEQVKSTHLLDGKIGFFGRLPKIIEMLKNEMNRHDPIANAPQLVLNTGSLPARLTYWPDSALYYLGEFKNNYSNLLGQIMDMPRADVDVLEKILNLMPDGFKILPQPKIILEKMISDHPVKVEIVCSDPEANIYYTLDGSSPTEKSARYAGPFEADKTVEIAARAIKPGFVQSFKSVELFQLVYADSVMFVYPYSVRYSGGSNLALVNGKFGKPDDYKSDWVGFQQVDMIATIKLIKPRSLSSITARFLQSQDIWIFLPTYVKYEIASADKKFQNVFEYDMQKESETQSVESMIREVTASVEAKNIEYIRVTAKNIGTCPSWHRGAGGKAWLFVDEIVLK